MSMIPRAKSFTHKGNSFEVKVPNVGQIIDIETRKSILSQGQYGKLVSFRTKDGEKALDFIDCVATLTVLCPKFVEGLKVSLLELDSTDMAEVIKDYKDQIDTWLKDLEKLSNISESKDTKENA